MPSGRTSAGEPARRESSQPASPPGCARPTDLRSGFGTKANSIFQARRLGEHRTSGEKKYYLANLPAETDLRTLAATICEQAHQQLKEELLDHKAFTVTLS
jgi:hypothetical protein